MAFCIKEKQFVDTGYTAVENKFFINYMPAAPDIRTAVYLLGLALSDSNGDDNACRTIADKLNISAEEVLDAYRYWEELGLVTILNDNAPQILYHALRNGSGTLKKIRANKYTKFSDAMQSVIEGRMITVAEYKEYYSFLEETTFQPEALVYVAKYCSELKGNDISYQYILTVARNQLIKGATTLAAVTENLSAQQKYDDDLKIIFKAIGSNRRIEYADRVFYEKWTKDFGFTLDTVKSVAKNCKTGGMGKLNAKLTEYYKKGALSVKEIENYETQKCRLYELAKALTSAIGVYYQSLDAVVEENVSVWLQRGYDDETLLAVAKYCFKSGIRTMQGLGSIIDKLYKNGVIDLKSLDDYLARLAATDEKIGTVLAKCGLDRRIIANDRLLFRTWTEDWNLSLELIEYAAEQGAGTNAPMAYVNRLLLQWKNSGVRTVEQARNSKASTAAIAEKKVIIGKDMERRHYTDDQINALFSALDEEE